MSVATCGDAIPDVATLIRAALAAKQRAPPSRHAGSASMPFSRRMFKAMPPLAPSRPPVGQIGFMMTAAQVRDHAVHPCACRRTNRQPRVRRKIHFARRLKRIARACPPGANFSLSFYQKSCLYSAVPPRSRGVSRSSRTLSAGCDGRVGVAAWSFMPTNNIDAHGQVARSRYPDAGITAQRV